MEKYSFKVYEDYAMFCGIFPYDVVRFLLEFCSKQGFICVVPCDCGFKVTRGEKNHQNVV